MLSEERLAEIREQAGRYAEGWLGDCVHAASEMYELLDHIDALQRQVAELRRALENACMCGGTLPYLPPHQQCVPDSISVELDALLDRAARGGE